MTEQKPRSFPYRGTTRQQITIEFPELTWLCPKQGYPDFAVFRLEYVPDKKVVELKSLKLWLTSYRNVGIGHERLADELFTTLWKLISPDSMKLTLDINPRGNMKDTIVIELN